MAGRYIARTIETLIKRAVAEFPVIALTGPRQSGKTTLVRLLFGKTHKYVSLESPDIRASAVNDPRGFLKEFGPPVILDEIQHVPELMSYIKDDVDSNRRKKGQYILTGSQNLLLLEKVTESLAGRVAVLKLYPFAFREILGYPEKPLIWEKTGSSAKADSLSYGNLWKKILTGGYPELVSERGRDISLWHSSYIQTYLERDVRMIRQIGDLILFQNFLQTIAARNGQMLNMKGISSDLGVALNTIKSWLSILESTFQIVILRPFFANVGKRLVKTPKIYFTDSGTLCHLAGLSDPKHAASGPMAGSIFESVVLSEIRKSIIHRGINANVYFWRSMGGLEIDFIVETEGKLIPIEVKLSTTPRPEMAHTIKMFMDENKRTGKTGYIVHPGDVRLPLAQDILALPFSDL